MTYLCAPESLQGAVAAGLVGAGDRFLGTLQNVPLLLQSEIHTLTKDDSHAAFAERAREIVRAYRQARRIIAGLEEAVKIEFDRVWQIFADQCRRCSRCNCLG